MANDVLEALCRDNAWATAPGSRRLEDRVRGLLLLNKSPELRTHLPIAPLVPAVGVALRAVLIGQGPKHPPSWLNAEGVVWRRGGLDSRSQLVGREPWGELSWPLNIDLIDALSSRRHYALHGRPLARPTVERLEGRADHAMRRRDGIPVPAGSGQLLRIACSGSPGRHS